MEEDDIRLGFPYTLGALGCMAVGEGGQELNAASLTVLMIFLMPGVVGVYLQEIQDWVSALQDVLL